LIFKFKIKNKNNYNEFNKFKKLIIISHTEPNTLLQFKIKLYLTFNKIIYKNYSNYIIYLLNSIVFIRYEYPIPINKFLITT